MKSKNELKEIDIKNLMCYYFYNIINSTKTNFGNILLDKTLKNISVYNISYKTPITNSNFKSPNPLCIRFDKIDGYIIS